MMEDNLTRRVHEIVAETLGLTPKDISSEDELVDLGCDSLDVAHLVMELEDEFKITVSDNDMEMGRLKTVSDIESLVRVHDPR